MTSTSGDCRQRLVLALCLALPLASPLAQASELLDEPTEKLLVDAVVAAERLDLYNGRCRKDRSGRRSQNLNKELVSRFRMTVLDVLDDLTPERSYRGARKRIETGLLADLKAAGGCAGAKAGGMREALQTRYGDLMDEIDALP